MMNENTLSEKHNVTITYLEQCQRPTTPQSPRPLFKTALMRSFEPPLTFYRYMFDQVGSPWCWVSRRYMDDDTLKSHIHDKDVYFYVLYVEGSPAGMLEIDARADHRAKGEVEIKFFGLTPDYIGRGLARWFFYNAIELAWALDPQKVVLETCTGDHPAALSFYQKMGFSVTGQAQGIIEWRG